MTDIYTNFDQDQPPLIENVNGHPETRYRTIKERVLEHLLAGKTLTDDQAKDLFKCENLSGTIFTLRKMGYYIETDKLRDGDGNRYVSYRLLRHIDKGDDDDDRNDFVREESSPPDVRNSETPIASSVTVRAGVDGMEMQVGNGDFYRLTPMQIRYLTVNLKLFSDAD